MTQAPHRLKLMGRAPSFAEMLEQLGLANGSEKAFAGPAVVDLNVEQPADGTLRVSADIGLGSSRARGNINIERPAGRPTVTGNLSIEALDPELIALGFTVGELAFGFPPGPPSRWPGNWPRQPLGWDWARECDADIAIDWPVGEKRGSGKLTLQQGALELLAVDAPVAGGRLSGSFDLDARAAAPQIATTARVESADLAALLSLVGLRESASGPSGPRLDGSCHRAVHRRHGADPQRRSAAGRTRWQACRASTRRWHRPACTARYAIFDIGRSADARERRRQRRRYRDEDGDDDRSRCVCGSICSPGSWKRLSGRQIHPRTLRAVGVPGRIVQLPEPVSGPP